jgi:hypothetical protein
VARPSRGHARPSAQAAGRPLRTQATRREQDCRRPRSGAIAACRSAPLSRPLDPRHGELPVDAVGFELDLVAGLDRREHGRIGHAEHHGHALVHVEFLHRAVTDRDPRPCLIDLGDDAVDELGIGDRGRSEQESDGCRRHELLHCQHLDVIPSARWIPAMGLT